MNESYLFPTALPMCLILQNFDIYNSAYVAAQNYGNAWIINLSNLSGCTPQGENSDPIRRSDYKDIGYRNWGHTLNVASGLLFFNKAISISGCKIFDLNEDPWNPKELVKRTASSGGDDCHDSYLQTINDNGIDRDILITSDGWSARWRLFDITNIRSPNFKLSVLGITPYLSGFVYAHECVLNEDGSILFVFDEFHNFDIGVYDVSDLTDPKLVRQFQWSENSKTPSRVHNGFVRGNYLFVAYYEAGLRVFDIANVYTGISEVGKLETFRDPDGNGILDKNITSNYLHLGAWNIYVGLPSGKVLISDTNSGTSVVQITSQTLSPVSSPSNMPTKQPVSSPVDLPTVSPCASYNRKKACRDNGCWWKLLEQTCVTSKVCSLYDTQFNCKKAKCYWYAKEQVCFISKPCLSFNKKKACKANNCYWYPKQEKGCFTSKPCFVNLKKNKCMKQDGCSWDDDTCSDLFPLSRPAK